MVGFWKAIEVALCLLLSRDWVWLLQVRISKTLHTKDEGMKAQEEWRSDGAGMGEVLNVRVKP